MGPSTLSSWVLLIARSLSARGIDAHEVLRRAKLDPAQLEDPNSRYPLAAVQRLWVLAAEETRDPCFGLAVGRTWHPTTFHALGYSALASATLREALGYVARYSRIVSTGARLELVDGAREVRLRLAPVQAERGAAAPALRIAACAGLAALALLCREVRGNALALERVVVGDPDRTCEEALRAFFGCPLAFDGGEYALVFRAETVDEALRTANPVLVRANEQVLAQYAARLDASHVADRLRSWLIRALPSGQSGQAEAARFLNLSLRSMQRKLGEEGTTYRAVLDDTRRHLAELYAGDSTLSSAEISYLLGFAEASSYSRALRRWRGAR